MVLSERERIQILMMIGFGDRARSVREVCDLFNTEHPERAPISISAVSKIHKKFQEEGHVRDRPRSGRPKIAEDTQLDVLLSVEETPNSSTRQLAREFNVSKSTIGNIFRKTKYHPYKICLVHELSEDDFDRRVQFCEQLMLMCDNDPFFIRNILFSDEATFTLHGTVNRQNCRYWARQNPRWMREIRTQYPQKLNVWAGLIGNRIIGPFFFNGNLTAEMYLDFLQNYLIPSLAEIFPNHENPNLPSQRIWFQQDGAPPHYAGNVRHYLENTFPNRWIGRRGAIEWPARSPDLTPIDYFLWGYLKSKVYATKPENLEDLRQRIEIEVRRITPEMIENVQNEFYYRLGYCQDAQGQHFEHLL